MISVSGTSSSDGNYNLADDLGAPSEMTVNDEVVIDGHSSTIHSADILTATFTMIWDSSNDNRTFEIETFEPSG